MGCAELSTVRASYDREMSVVRVPGVTADFRAPRGWPTPTDSWIRANAFWQPPAGWTPMEGVRPAPEGWRFWAPNPLWHRVNATHFRRITPVRRAADILGYAVVLFVLLRWVLGPQQTVVLIVPTYVAALAGVTCLVIFAVLRGRLTRDAVAAMTEGAAVERHQRLVREYQKYLSGVA